MDINKINLVCRRVEGLNVGPPDYKPKADLTSQLHSLVIAVLGSQILRVTLIVNC